MRRLLIIPSILIALILCGTASAQMGGFSPFSGGDAINSHNLSDLGNATAARRNLGLGSVATVNLSDTYGKSATYPLTQCTTIKAAADTDDYPALFRFAYAVTVRAWHCLQGGSTNVIGGVDNCDANGANCHAVSINLTCSTTEADNSTLNAYGAFASGHYLGWHTTSVSGTNTWLTVCFDYTID
jgi:hypothetical protein